MATVLLSCALAVLVLMVAAWLVSLAVHDASIVDIVWGLGFVLVAAVAVVVGNGDRSRRLLLAVLVAVWSLRLAGYLAWRNLGHGEDYRYQAMRKKWGDAFPIRSLFQVFLFQGLVMWVVSLPVQLAVSPAHPAGLGPLAWVGVAVWLVGMGFEAVGDLQLTRFKARPDSDGQVMDQGLWRYTRHPNYFGDFCVWWGLFLVAAETGPGRWGVIGPLVMSFMLLRVSGVAMLEKTITKRRPGYTEYIEHTNAFFPGPPKAASSATGSGSGS